MPNDSPEVKAWVRAQEGVIELELRIRALASFMEKNRTAALNPTRTADLDASSNLLQELLRQISEIERGIGGSQLTELKAELEEVRREARKREAE